MATSVHKYCLISLIYKYEYQSFEDMFRFAKSQAQQVKKNRRSYAILNVNYYKYTTVLL